MDYKNTGLKVRTHSSANNQIKTFRIHHKMAHWEMIFMWHFPPKRHNFLRITRVLSWFNLNTQTSRDSYDKSLTKTVNFNNVVPILKL